jgi:predicted DNA-binding transcriptional regulator AlpA
MAKKKAAAPPAPKTFHIDKRASTIAALPISLNDDELLSTSEMAQWFGVSHQWLEVRRHRNDGPPYERLGPRCIRYRVGKVKAWLDARSHRGTREYAA